MGECLRVLCLALSFSTVRIAAAQQAAKPDTRPVLEITQNTKLDPAKTYGRIVIKASGITIDGRGAWVVGATQGDPKDYTDVGVSAKGVSNVTLRNLNVKGWQTGLKIEDGSNWLVENCNISDNFHFPAQGWHWGDFNGRGGIVLKRVDHSKLLGNKAKENWDACELVHSDDNVVKNNDFSYASNTCMWLWTACHNEIANNNLSHGIRVNPGEIHARDSACVLIEDGSDNNNFTDNDITYGGDGVFIRGTGGWGSRGNVFEHNDTSYAHNNCFESQSPGNTYRHNKANHGSHGIFLGGSRDTIVEDNEACYNGVATGLHFAPGASPTCRRDRSWAPSASSSPATADHVICRRNTVRRQRRRRHRHLRHPFVRPGRRIAPLDHRKQRYPRQSLGHLHGVRRLDQHRRQHVRSQLGRQRHPGRQRHQLQPVRRRSPHRHAAQGRAGRPLDGHRRARSRAWTPPPAPIRTATRSASAGTSATARSCQRRAWRMPSRPPATTASA